MADQSIISALILGLIEGLTEFIPVSSTAHILLAGHFLGFKSPGNSFAVLIQLGTGSNRDVVTMIDRIIAGLAGSGTQVVIAEWSSAAGLPPLWPDATIVGGHPLAQYYRAFDFTVAAAGYNTFHEVIAYAVPAIFVANGHHSMDDQVGRARYAEANGLALSLDERDLTELPEMLKVMLSEPAREFLRENCRRHATPRGAEEAASLIAQRLGQGVSLVR